MSRKRKKCLLILGIAVSLILQFMGISAGFGQKFISGTCIGFGAVMFSFCINRLYRLSYEKEFPELLRQEKIEFQDERNMQIRIRAKSRSADIIQWFIIGLGWINFITGGALWLTLAAVGIYLLLYMNTKAN